MTSLNRTLILLAFPLLCVHCLIAQEKGMSFTLGRSSDNSYTKGKEAEVIGTFPDSLNAKDAWLTNAFFELTYTDTNRWQYGLIAEIHRNTLIAKEQHVVQFGASIGKVFTLIEDEIGEAKFQIPSTLTLKLSEDRKADEETFQIIAASSFNTYTGKDFLKTRNAFPRLASPLAHIVQFSHAHSIGVTYLGKDEDILLGTLDLEFNSFLFPRLINKWTGGKYTDFFKIQFSYRGRTPFYGTTDLDLDSAIDLQCGINIRLGTASNTIGIAYDWIQGANPLEGLADQKYETLTAKVKFTIQK